ncbi:MAG: class I SAM-dependent methyltransferase [bacterium]|nr:class I SAM-dependent methyltransferase [bacterium]
MLQVKKVVRSIKSRGLKETILVIFYDFIFSLRYSTKFNEAIELNSLRIDSPNKKNGVLYQSSSYYYAKLAFKNLPVDFTKSSLVDFGSGKGNVLILAHKLGFRIIIGVEFAEELVHFSKERMNRIIRSASSSDIKILHSDAASFTIPKDANVFFFYNPFNRNVFEKVLNNIEESLSRNKRRIFIVYINAVIGLDMFSKYDYSEIFKHSSKEKTEILILSK